MRPQSALLPSQHKKIHYNQQSAYYYILNEQGKQLKVNRRGQLIGKFVKDFTGFCNFKERKNRSFKDKTLMYSQPNLGYNKNKAFVCPKGSKLLGYAQFPYELKCDLPQFLQESTFNESCKLRQSENEGNKNYIEQNTASNVKSSRKDRKLLNKFQSLKSLLQPNLNLVDFDMMKDKIRNDQCNGFSSQQNRKLKKKQQKSIILEAHANYSQQNRAKHANSKSTTFLQSTNSSNCYNRTEKQNRKVSYFQQSLSNIEKTETPNYINSNTNQQQFLNFTQSDSLNSQFGQTSLKSNCYKSSCRYAQYVPKRRYMKANQDRNVVGLSQLRMELDLEIKEQQIVNKLKDQLKIYQPIVVQPTLQKNNQNEKKGNKDKPKVNPVQTVNKK